MTGYLEGRCAGIMSGMEPVAVVLMSRTEDIIENLARLERQFSLI